MSIIAQQLEEAKIRNMYIEKATEEQLAECEAGKHVAKDQHFQGVHGDFLKDSWPRRCKVCGEHLFPDEWEPVESVLKFSSESDCKHETIGYYTGKDGKDKTVNRFPQACKHCGIDLKPKTWKEFK